MKQNPFTIPIVMAADNNYAVPLLVSLNSIIENKKSNTDYSFYFLIPESFDEKIISTIETILVKNHNKKPIFIKMGEEYKNESIQISHTSSVTYYRLSLPKIINEDRCIYLDTDTIVLSDLSELFSLLSDEMLIAGVKAAGYYWPEESLKEKAKKLHINTFDAYVNAGVLVMNLKLMRKIELVSVFHSLLDKNWKGQDQDILNSACYGKIQIIPPKYNSMTKYSNDRPESYDSTLHPYLSKVYTWQEWNEACINPVIIHYADQIKPWDDIGAPFSNLWWKYLIQVDRFYPCFDNMFDLLVKKEKNRTKDDSKLELALSQLSDIKSSFSFRLGRIITFPIRKLRDTLTKNKQ